jgi:hypothetical protein
MKLFLNPDRRHRVAVEIMCHAWDVVVSYESFRQWWGKFGVGFAGSIRRWRPCPDGKSRLDGCDSRQKDRGGDAAVLLTMVTHALAVIGECIFTSAFGAREVVLAFTWRDSNESAVPTGIERRALCAERSLNIDRVPGY